MNECSLPWTRDFTINQTGVKYAFQYVAGCLPSGFQILVSNVIWAAGFVIGQIYNYFLNNVNRLCSTMLP